MKELARQAAQGTVLYNDDTTMRILKFTAEARAEALPPGAKMQTLRDWMAKQWETHAVELNSGLWQAIRYV